MLLDFFRKKSRAYSVNPFQCQREGLTIRGREYRPAGGSVLNKGKSDGKTTDMSVLTEVRDLEAVISYVRSLPYTGKNLLLMGCSQGGFVSALTAAKHPDLVNQLVLFYPAL